MPINDEQFNELLSIMDKQVGARKLHEVLAAILERHEQMLRVDFLRSLERLTLKTIEEIRRIEMEGT